MTSSDSLIDLISSGQLDAAMELALAHRSPWVEEQLDYPAMDEHAENVSEFFQRWLVALPPLERLQAAVWVTGQYVLPLVHLPHSYGIGARLYLEAYQAAAAEMAFTLRDFYAFTYGPDAETPTEVALRLAGYAEQLEQMHFDAPVVDD